MAEQVIIIFKDDKGHKLRVKENKGKDGWALWDNSLGKGAPTLFEILENMKKEYPHYRLLEIQCEVSNSIST